VISLVPHFTWLSYVYALTLTPCAAFISVRYARSYDKSWWRAHWKKFKKFFKENQKFFKSKLRSKRTIFYNCIRKNLAYSKKSEKGKLILPLCVYDTVPWSWERLQSKAKSQRNKIRMCEMSSSVGGATDSWSEGHGFESQHQKIRICRCAVMVPLQKVLPFSHSTKWKSCNVTSNGRPFF